MPDLSGGNFSLQWEDGKLTINGTTIDLSAVEGAFEACKAQLPDPGELPDLPDLPGILGQLGPFGQNAQKFADCMAEKGFDFPFGGGAMAGGLFGRGADADALIKVLETAADALRARLDAGAGSDVEQRLAALDAAIEALKADAANAPAPDPGTSPSAPDMTELHDALESCRAELTGD